VAAIAAGTLITTVASGGGALAARAALLQKARAYSTLGYQHGVEVDIITSARNPRRIEAGTAPLGAQFATGGIYVQCPGAPRSSAILPFVTVPFPAITLKLSHGRYGFARTLHVSRPVVLSSLKLPVTLSITFTGTVRSPQLLAGTVRVSGQQCRASSGYRAKLTHEAVAPGK
jgi:hypothetical protein